jgi:hypothetical protein
MTMKNPLNTWRRILGLLYRGIAIRYGITHGWMIYSSAVHHCRHDVRAQINTNYLSAFTDTAKARSK